jgi:Ala-tRNA(Pro) deacylase
MDPHLCCFIIEQEEQAASLTLRHLHYYSYTVISYRLLFLLMNNTRQQEHEHAAAASDDDDDNKEDPGTSQKLEAFLGNRGIPYTVTTHLACRTSLESATIRNVSLEAGAKALVLKANNDKYMMAVMSASHRFVSKQFKRVAACKKIRFATPDEVWHVTKCRPGAVPPFGSIFGMDVWVDRSLKRQEIIHFNAGLRTCSISMTYADYIAAEQPHCHVFTEEELLLEN